MSARIILIDFINNIYQREDSLSIVLFAVNVQKLISFFFNKIITKKKQISPKENEAKNKIHLIIIYKNNNCPLSEFFLYSDNV